MKQLPTPLERIHLELTNHCNFSCEFCPDRIMTRPRGLMKEKLAKKALDQIAKDRIAKQVDLHLMGEPTLHPKLPEIISYGTGLDLRMSLTTNGSLLTPSLVDRLIDSRLNQLIISVQTPDAKSFKKRCPKGITFDTYSECITSAVKKIINSDCPTEVIITFRTTPWRRFLLPSTKISIINNSKDLSARLETWIKLVAKDLISEDEFKTTINKIKNFSALRWNKIEIRPRLVFESRILGDWAHSKIDKQDAIRTKFAFCHGLSEHFGILCSGDFVFCCADFDGRTRVGLNIEDTPIVEWMKHNEVIKAAKGFSKLRVNHDYCQRCLGGPSKPYAVAKTIGSIFYFKVYRYRKKEVLTKSKETRT